MPTSQPHYIIAIGASAGSTEEINAFFDHTPLDDVSYIIVQHLSVAFKSRMVELLARHSKLKVEEAEHNMEVKRNQVYLIPNDKFMTISNNRLQLTEKKIAKGPHLTINTLFTSLAADAGPKAIGIILSGLGSDGTEGVSSIKNAGGMVLVRNPETTEYSSMPSHAIATGMVDFILEPEFMPGVIEDYVKHHGDVKYKDELIAEDNNDEKYITTIIALIKEKSPLDFSDYKQTTILRRTQRRAAYKNFTKLSDYLEFLKSTPEEVDALTKNFLISVTAFSRDKEAFAVIKNTVFPDLLSRITPDEELKIWVAGCATGEEVYSLAMLITEQLNANSQNNVVKIFATDIDSAALAYAGKGIYPKAAVKNIPRDQINNFFLKEGNDYRVKPEIRKMVIFAQHNLVKNPPYCNMHFISCCNLLIYMTPVLQKRIFTLLLFGLKMDGYLFLGTSENPLSIMNNLEIVDKKWKIYKNIKPKQAVSFDAFSMPDLQDIKRAAPIQSMEDSSKNANYTTADAMLLNLATQLDHLAICVDEHNNVLKSYGDPTKYFLQKYFTSHLPDLLPKSLAVAYNILINNTLKTNKSDNINGIKIKNGKHTIKVNITLDPLPQKKGEKKLLMVTLREDKLAKDKQLTEDTLFDEHASLNQYCINLEEEVKELKDKLQLSYERLNASHMIIEACLLMRS
jgi:two-component system CheB/CheR fusion protein